MFAGLILHFLQLFNTLWYLIHFPRNIFLAALDCGTTWVHKHGLALWPLVHNPATCFIYFLHCHRVDVTVTRVCVQNGQPCVVDVTTIPAITTDTTTTTNHSCKSTDCQRKRKLETNSLVVELHLSDGAHLLLHIKALRPPCLYIIYYNINSRDWLSFD